MQPGPIRLESNHAPGTKPIGWSSTTSCSSGLDATSINTSPRSELLQIIEPSASQSALHRNAATGCWTKQVRKQILPTWRNRILQAKDVNTKLPERNESWVRRKSARPRRPAALENNEDDAAGKHVDRCRLEAARLAWRDLGRLRAPCEAHVDAKPSLLDCHDGSILVIVRAQRSE